MSRNLRAIQGLKTQVQVASPSNLTHVTRLAGSFRDILEALWLHTGCLGTFYLVGSLMLGSPLA